MMIVGIPFCIFVGIVPFLYIVSSSSPPISLLGVAPQDELFYKTRVTECKDGSKNLTKAQLNDDFCDCNDGSDEPGTSACPRGKFYCHNAGHVPITLFSSRVNDGICDCCDGSDEYDGKVKCPNICWKAGKVARDKLEKEIATYREGIPVRERKIEKAKRAHAEDTVALPNLKIEEKTLTKLVKRLQVRKERIEKLERKERLRKANSNIKEEEEEEKATSEIGSSKEAPKTQHEKESSNHAEMSKEELGRLIASRWTGELVDDSVKKTDTPEEKDKAPENGDSNVHAKEHEHDQDKNEDSNVHAKEHEHDHDQDKNEDSNVHAKELEHDQDKNEDSSSVPNDPVIATLSSLSWWALILESIRDILESLNLFPISLNVLDGDSIRKQYDDSSEQLGDVKSKIASLTKKLEYDYGDENEFYLLYDRCYETKQNTYVYKVCPFRQASQEEGRTTTWLGSWNMFQNEYSEMLFSNGDACWNGPARSLKVILKCGLKTELSDISEPSRCEYAASMSTPILCREDKLKELERELDAMKEEKPQGHDEL